MNKYLVIAVYIGLILITLLVFWQVRNFDFVNFDDQMYVYENQHVLNGLTWDGVIWAFTTGYAANWHPVTWLSHMLDCQVFVKTMIASAVMLALCSGLIRAMTPLPSGSGAFWYEMLRLGVVVPAAIATYFIMSKMLRNESLSLITGKDRK